MSATDPSKQTPPHPSNCDASEKEQRSLSRDPQRLIFLKCRESFSCSQREKKGEEKLLGYDEAVLSMLSSQRSPEAHLLNILSLSPSRPCCSALSELTGDQEHLDSLSLSQSSGTLCSAKMKLHLGTDRSALLAHV